jgi:hypothetical protein
LFVDAGRAYPVGLAGTPGFGGGGGGGLVFPARPLGFGARGDWPTWDSFRAAMRCWIDCGCASSSSAMFVLLLEIVAMKKCEVNRSVVQDFRILCQSGCDAQLR